MSRSRREHRTSREARTAERTTGTPVASSALFAFQPIAPVVPTTEPLTLTAGTTWKWTKSLADYPVSEGWSASYYLTGKTSLSFATTPTLATNTYNVTVLPATTATVAAGTYDWTLRLSLSGESFDGACGTFEVLATPSVAPGSDQRTHAEKLLALVEQEIAARVLGDGSAHVSYTIGSRSIDKIDLTELYNLRNRYALEVQRERYGRIPDTEVQFVRA